ncbi:MAG: hypothetical protein GX605_08235 [Chloroflexi bacterium]|nr:hypothetical protein [Chloroflexota bacterium]
MAKPQMVEVQCPACRHVHTANAHAIVDGGQSPELKASLLRGRLNMAVCPQCGRSAALETPFLYVDTDKEVALVYLSPTAGMDNNQQQSLIGRLTNQVLNELPPEKRKGYLFQPRMFFTLASLTDAVLEADGVSKDEVVQSRQRSELAEKLLAVAADEKTVQQLIKDHDRELDETFFRQLAALQEEALAQGDRERAEKVALLQERLVQHSTWAKETVAAAQKKQLDEMVRAREKLLASLVRAKKDAEVESLVMSGRSVIDYEFYQKLTAQIDAAEAAGNKDEARRLALLRDRVLTLTEQMDKEAEAAIGQAMELLNAVVQSKDPQAVLQERIEEVNPVFLNLVALNVNYAVQQGQEQVARALQMIHALAVDVIRRNAPAEMQLLDELMAMGAPAARRQLLEGSRSLLNQDFLQMVDGLLNDLEVAGQRPEARALEAIRQEVVEVMRG